MPQITLHSNELLESFGSPFFQKIQTYLSRKIVVRIWKLFIVLKKYMLLIVKLKLEPNGSSGKVTENIFIGKPNWSILLNKYFLKRACVVKSEPNYR